jgi:hypothetical protein
MTQIMIARQLQRYKCFQYQGENIEELHEIALML